MSIKKLSLSLILVLILVQNSKQSRFTRRIQGIGQPYYKILMSLGICKEKVLYFDQKIWGKIAFNRVLDIYYKCDNENFKVSRVEIRLVLNNTSCFASSEAGVGNSDFYATLYLPANLNFVVYTLTIYTCNRDSSESAVVTQGGLPEPKYGYLPFIHTDKKLRLM